MSNDTLMSRLRAGWNVFRNGLPETELTGPASSRRLDRTIISPSTERSMVLPLYNRIGIDVAAVPIRHVRLDENERFLSVIPSGLYNCLSVEANIDQSGRQLVQDIVQSLCDEGVVAVVPVDTTINPNITGSYDILTLRTGKIIQWYPYHVMVRLFNENRGIYQDKKLEKRTVAIIENPLYSVMNQKNSVLKRLIEKLNILDAIDLQSGSGKLDIILQVPYTVRDEDRRKQAEGRRATMEAQLKDSQYGVAYMDGTEKVVQLNRPVENQLMSQIEYLSAELFSQLGISQEILAGTAPELAYINYFNRTIEPFLAAITGSFYRTFLTKTARTRMEAIMSIRDPFRLIPSSLLAEMADKFTRNEILTGNEFRGLMGVRPSKDPKADELRNKNLNQPDTQESSSKPVQEGRAAKMEGVPN